MNFIDSHCHLFFEDFKNDIDAVIKNAVNAGVTKMIVPATSVENFDATVQLAEKYEHVFAAVGIHPYDAHTATPRDFATIQKYLTHPKVVAVGETGLDFHRENSKVSEQLKNFEWHIQAAKDRDMPIIVHCRSAKDEVYTLLKTHKPKGVVHCFSEDLEYAKKLMDMGFYISFTGILTYESSKRIQNVAKQADIHRILIETDSPYLKPGARRTENRCEPKDVVMVAQKIAELREMSLEEVAAITTQNTHDLFVKCGR